MQSWLKYHSVLIAKKTLGFIERNTIIKDVTYEGGAGVRYLQFCIFGWKETKKDNMLHKLCHLESFSRFDLRIAQRKSRLWKSLLCIYTKRGQSRIVQQCGEICFSYLFLTSFRKIKTILL